MIEAEPECQEATINGHAMHNLNRNMDTGECVFCMALRSAYNRGTQAKLEVSNG